MTQGNVEDSDRPLSPVEATRDFFRFAATGLADSLCVTTVDLESFDPRIVFVNGAFERLTGYSADEVLGRNPRFLQGANTDREVIERLKADLLAGREFKGSTANYRKDGTEYQVDWRVSGVHNGERLVNWVAVQRDVTDRWLLQRELQKAHDEMEVRVERRTIELKEANEELEAFCHTVAHDLKAPIRNIVLRSHLMEEDLGEEASADVLEHLRGFARNAKRLADLTDDLLQYTRLGKQVVRRTAVDLTELARRVGAEIECDCHEGDSSIEVEDGLVTDAEPRLLELLLINLFENACKYSRSGVRVRMGRERTDRGEAFFVRDDGLGFDMAYAHKLFQPFERLHNDSRIDGTGIGLANVRRIVERHGGEIWADSKPGEGATFWFTLGSEHENS